MRKITILLLLILITTIGYSKVKIEEGGIYCLKLSNYKKISEKHHRFKTGLCRIFEFDNSGNVINKKIIKGAMLNHYEIFQARYENSKEKLFYAGGIYDLLEYDEKNNVLHIYYRNDSNSEKVTVSTRIPVEMVLDNYTSIYEQLIKFGVDISSIYDDYKKVYEIKEKETNTVTNDTKSKEREFCKKYTKFRYSTNYRIEQDINLTYSLRYGNSNYNKFEKLQEISNAKLCKLNNFYE